MKATIKSVAVALTVLAVVVAILLVVDGSVAKNVSAGNKTYLRVSVIDLDGKPVHNAQVQVDGNTFNTDNKGLSPAIELGSLANSYDGAITEWGTVTVTVTKADCTPAVVFNCIVYAGQTRKLTVKVYPTDGSDLPYTVYVESPPDDYVRERISAHLGCLVSAPISVLEQANKLLSA